MLHSHGSGWDQLTHMTKLANWLHKSKPNLKTKLESYWQFNKAILLMLSYILVVSTAYILLISIYPMLKARKMKSIASSAIFANLFKNYFRVQKYGGFLLNCTKISLTVLCWNFQQSALWVDFKVEPVLQSRRKKMKLCG